MHLGPVTGRDADLCGVLDGYVSNAMREQNQLNRIPLATCADYAYNPRAYDPFRSLGQAILLQTDSAAGREVLRDLVAAYPGMLWVPESGNSTSFNPVRAQLERLLAGSDAGQAATACVADLQSLSERFGREFPKSYEPEKKTLAADLAFARQKLAARKP